MEKPIIGVLLDYEINGSFSSRPYYALRQRYFDTISQTGGIPIGIPYLQNEIHHFISVCQGFLFPGGFYPFPDEVYDKINSKNSFHHPRYPFESKLMRAALKQNMPVLGICAGMQVMAAIHGCKLFRDISNETTSPINHLNSRPAEQISHEVFITSNTLLEKILGVQKFNVNSAHNESIKTVSAGIKTNALASDGIVEGIEVPKHRFCIGVQWHPEFFNIGQNPNLELFKALVSYSSN